MKQNFKTLEDFKVDLQTERHIVCSFKDHLFHNKDINSLKLNF